MSAETARQEARRLPVWPIEPRQKLVNPYGRLWRIHTAWAAGLAPEQAKSLFVESDQLDEVYSEVGERLDGGQKARRCFG